MPDLIITERRILIVELMDGRRSRYIPPQRGKWRPLVEQLQMARRIGAKPLYAFCIRPLIGSRTSVGYLPRTELDYAR